VIRSGSTKFVFKLPSICRLNSTWRDHQRKELRFG
jgi:hypothetical protein